MSGAIMPLPFAMALMLTVALPMETVAPAPLAKVCPSFESRFAAPSPSGLSGVV